MRKLLTPKILLFLFVLLVFPAHSFAQVAISVAIGPPVLPVYAQPPCPTEGFMWTPGYWGWRTEGYYWVPGTWVVAPYVGALWTPPYWGFDGGRYRMHIGYWLQSLSAWNGFTNARCSASI